ncbi:NAD-dependent succinate-semialdehyde dehydrogenase [Haladaptatus sp. DJG-WS-42]|uniref:NAD-dependent succinate-semialdehyde dehydrogenase n=1 Tax=Haladaptatus sp. DJG-WS-42 TaxID=3120516 RepID=UPI0030CF4236
MQRVNPATGETLSEIAEHSDDEVDAALDTSMDAFDEWRDVPIRERQQLLSNAAVVLRENKQEYADVMTEEMGKPIAASVAEVEKCAWVCDYYAEHAGEQLQDHVIGSEPHAQTKVTYEPLGAVLAVMPWNFPFWQVFRFAAPHLTSGNVGLLKHASNVPECALAIEDVFRKAGYPEGVFQTLLIGSSKVGDVIADDRVAAVTLTGSEAAGRSVAETAGKNLKKTVLELGGSDPFVVLDDADVTTAAKVGARARTINSGQSCIAAKRFIVHEAVYDEFLDAFLAELESLTVGDPTDEETDIGPQAREGLMDGLHEQVTKSVDAGATVALGGEPLDRDGFYYPPTVLTDVPDGSPAAEEEIFGPVASVFKVADEAEAIRVANDTNLGLGASVWTADLARGERVSHRIEAGCVFVNELVKSDPRLPFGGIKDSGYGRELAREGMLEFVNQKTMWIQDADGDAEISLSE